MVNRMDAKVAVVYEHSTADEISGVIVDGAAELMGDDVSASDYDAATEPWPGVPDIELPDAYKWELVAPEWARNIK